MDTNLVAFNQLLAHQRIKVGVDYAITYKYLETRVVCHEVWEPAIREAAAVAGVPLAAVLTYKFDA